MAPNPIADLEAQALWDASVDGLLLVDPGGIIVATNPSLDQQFDYARGALTGRSVEELLPREQRAAHVGHRSAFAEQMEARPMASRHLEGMRSDGTTFPVNISLAPVEIRTGTVTFAAVRDLTARVDHERALADANRRRAIAEDHDRIANDLHDSVIQRLFALGLGLQGLPPHIDRPDVADRVSSTVDALDEIIGDIRSTIYGLRSKRDDGQRLRPMILALADEVEPTLGFVPDVSFAGALDAVVDETLKGHIVSVVREALSNAGRHAGATSVSVTVRVGDELAIEVIDNGCGIDPSNERSSGLANLQWRAEACGGSFVVDAAAHGGTRLRWAIPADQIL